MEKEIFAKCQKEVAKENGYNSWEDMAKALIKNKYGLQLFPTIERKIADLYIQRLFDARLIP